jgi:hypothetical protein
MAKYSHTNSYDFVMQVDKHVIQEIKYFPQAGPYLLAETKTTNWTVSTNRLF